VGPARNITAAHNTITPRVDLTIFIGINS